MSDEILGDIVIVMVERNMELYLSNMIDEIRDLFYQVTCTKYIGNLDLDVIEDCNNKIFTLKIGLNCPDAAPIVLGFCGDESQFMNYLKKEFRKRRLQEIEYTVATLINEDSLVYPVIEI
jgi:hypothetical protein